MDYFTLPVGYDPKRAVIKHRTSSLELLDKVMQSEDDAGLYTLYQWFDGCDPVPICRVERPLIVGKPMVYLDTSAISYIDQPDTPEKEAVTLKFWKAVKGGAFQLVLSNVTLDEVMRCSEPKRSKMKALLKTATYTVIDVETTVTVKALASSICDQKLLPKRCKADTLHIASAIYSGCDVLASWNFSHLVNVSTINGVRFITLENGHPVIDLMTPAQIMEVYYGV